LPGLRGAGLHPRSTILHGDPRAALSELRATVPREPDAPGLRIEPLRDARVPAAVAIARDFFTSHPALGYLSPRIPVTSELQARIDAWAADNLRTAVDSRTGRAVVRADETMGYGMFLELEDPLLGRAGGLHICLHPEIHGRGVGTRMYRELAELMVARDVRVSCGSTANPAVLRIGERMRREVRGWRLEPV